MLQVIASQTAEHKRKKGKVTCTTCQLKGCVGRCRFKLEAVKGPRPSKAA
jgi:hypothetical protein